MTRFIAIDGEADSDGRYIVLCDSQGRVLYNPNGITTAEALDFLLCLPRKHEIVCYGLNYDANQWLVDVPRPALERIASDEHRCVYRNEYKLEWIPSKMFTVTVPQKSVTVCEVFGFFQTSFVKALQQYGMSPPQEIETMKLKRGTFSQKEIGRVIAYCRDECRLLVELMNKLHDACVTGGCVPRRRWIGAGSIASSLLMSKGVSSAHVYDVDLFERAYTDEYVLRAYFGGRVELYQQGWRNNVQAHDIRSAYPSVARHLPSLATSSVAHRRNYQPNLQALWRVEWNLTGWSGQVAPFPVRLPGGDICYPLRGSGVYHAPEVDAARRLFGDAVQIIDGLEVVPASDDKPLSWIEDVYAHRARFKAQGNFAEKALKLGLNSIYGKFAQGYGFGRKPPFQSYYWAGYITSATRARAMELASAMYAPVMTATDGIVGDRPLTDHLAPPGYSGKRLATLLLDNDGIGSWESTPYDRVATVQPGVYVAEQAGERLVKSRGFFARDVDYDALVEAFERDNEGAYHFKSRRFIGLKVALHRKDFGVWRQWIDERRSIAFEIKNKRAVVDGSNVLLYPPEGPYDSLPYEPKQSLYDDPSDSALENMVRDDQPHREVD